MEIEDNAQLIFCLNALSPGDCVRKGNDDSTRYYMVYGQDDEMGLVNLESGITMTNLPPDLLLTKLNAKVVIM